MNTGKQYNKRYGILRFSIKFFQTILYILVQVAFIPAAIIGIIHALYKEMLISKKLGISYSAIKTLQYRWFMHYFETRPDSLSVAFTKKFPCESHVGMWSVMGALIVSQRFFGFTTKLNKIVEPGKETLDTTAGIRVLSFDKLMEKYIDEVEQIVLPGVGFDLIALHFTNGKNVKVFELDQTNTLNIKVNTLKKAGIAHDWIKYIPVDYTNESWADKLLETGFDKTKKTLFLWQSVSLFLEEGLVKDTLEKMAGLCSEGSIIAQDFYSRTFSSGEYSKAVKRFIGLLERMGEPVKFGIDMANKPNESVESFLNTCGLTTVEYHQFGEKLQIEPFYCISVAKKLKKA